MLIIDDNRDAVESLQLLLGLQGCQARTAGDGPAGLELARTWMPDAVLCDIGLPGMDGFAVAAALRADPRTRGASRGPHRLR